MSDDIQKLGGLGKGLSSIWRDLTQEENLEQHVVAVEIPVRDIQPNPDQPRKYFDPTALEELKASLKKEGVLQPILVRKIISVEGKAYQIIAGERRWKASSELGFERIPSIVIECDDSTAIQLGLIENLQRDNLSAIDEAESLKLLIERYHKQPEEIAQLLSKSTSYVRNALRLLKLPPSVQELLQKGKISAGHARAIIEADDPDALARQIMFEKLTVRDAEDLARSQKHELKRQQRVAERQQNAEQLSDTLMLEEMLSDYFKVPAKIRLRGAGGYIQIYFEDFSQMEDLLDTLTKPTPPLITNS